MGRINWGRVVLGGILAALIINIGEYLINAVVLAKDWATNLANLHLPPDVTMNAVAIFNITGLIVGVMMVWLYAAIRSRYGAGVKTALIASIAIWLLAYAMPTLGYVGIGVVSQRIAIIAIGLALVEVVIAGIAGAWVYQEAAV